MKVKILNTTTCVTFHNISILRQDTVWTCGSKRGYHLHIYISDSESLDYKDTELLEGDRGAQAKTKRIFPLPSLDIQSTQKSWLQMQLTHIKQNTVQVSTPLQCVCTTWRSSWIQFVCAVWLSGLVLMNWNNFRKTQGSKRKRIKTAIDLFCFTHKLQ